MRRKQNNRSINSEITTLRDKIYRMKSLGNESHSSTKHHYSSNRSNKSCSNKHRRHYTEQASPKRHQRAKQQPQPIFVPVYIPYPVFHHYKDHMQRPQYPVSYDSVNLHQRFQNYDINEGSNNYNPVYKNLDNYQIQQRSSKIKQFSSRLKESLTNMESPKPSSRR